MIETPTNTVAETTVTPVVASIAPAELQTALALLGKLEKHHGAIAQAVAGNIGNDERAARMIAAAGDIEQVAVAALKLHALLHGSDETADMADKTLESLFDADREGRPEPTGTATTLENFPAGKAALVVEADKAAIVKAVPVQDSVGEGAESGKTTTKTDGATKTATETVVELETASTTGTT